jgi:regulator of sigma E protease
MATLKTVVIVLEVLILFNLLIFVHELGHFLAARWRKMRVDRFAIWFGKPIWKAKIKGVEYALGWIPAGGYVALPQMATMEMIEGKSDSGEPLPPASPLDKIIVAFAGPLFSFLLAVAFAVLVWGVGKPVNQAESSTTIGWVEPDGPAWKAGLRPGDKLLEVDNKPVSQFAPPARDSVVWRVITSRGTNIAFKYERGGEVHTTQATPYKRPTQWYERKALRQVLIDVAQKAMVGDVLTNSPAALAKLQAGDEIVAVNGERIYSPAAISHARDMLTNEAVKSLKLTIRRGSEEFERSLTPEKPLQPSDAKPALGIVWLVGSTNITLVHPRPMDQIKESAGQIFATLGALFAKNSDVGVQQLGGAVMIIRVYTNLFDNPDGWRLVLWFSVVLNVNLAMLNLLPFPVLDGGHITLALLEAIRRRPVSARILQNLQGACAIFLIGFMLFIAFFDTGDWLRSARQDRSQPVVFAPKP